ncbi:hypothetical protein B0T14DRAFT_518671 [Immersiella caudata]|uniref:Uncharacterized protein n=1 Tax=Immersiella caudata TaxID=314043 RepID=A0AA39WPF5_9PEZI|nr:hypothetical protein B0T14DRAFT_518671 [Immersiella caudata]
MKRPPSARTRCIQQDRLAHTRHRDQLPVSQPVQPPISFVLGLPMQSQPANTSHPCPLQPPSHLQ